MHRKFLSMMVLLTLGIASHANTSEEHSVIAAELLPVSLQTSWQVNKPQLGKFGHCAAAFDSRTDDNKMAFACSIYVKLDAVAQRKAIQHCDEQRVARNIKSACQLIK